ncbi:deoxyribonuclease [Stomatohabitans albus]|uniref:endonuclease III domain-containing protein n=1 Tax=Stomatohabitans albus TaxID=3110766 RepID=UPI00300C7F44
MPTPLSTPPTFREIYRVLDASVEAGNWWPADSDFEVFVGAILTQNTNWQNVVTCIDNLKQADCLRPDALLALEAETLETLIYASGYRRAKTRYLKDISTWFIEHHPDAHTQDTPTLRQDLLRVHGVGAETADDLLLYVYQRPVFIYDLYARRLIEATGHGIYTTYNHAKRTLDPVIEAEGFNAAEHAHFHGLIVNASKHARTQGGWPTYWPSLLARAGVDY